MRGSYRAGPLTVHLEGSAQSFALLGLALERYGEEEAVQIPLEAGRLAVPHLSGLAVCQERGMQTMPGAKEEPQSEADGELVHEVALKVVRKDGGGGAHQQVEVGLAEFTSEGGACQRLAARDASQDVATEVLATEGPPRWSQEGVCWRKSAGAAAGTAGGRGGGAGQASVATGAL